MSRGALKFLGSRAVNETRQRKKEIRTEKERERERESTERKAKKEEFIVQVCRGAAEWIGAITCQGNCTRRPEIFILAPYTKKPPPHPGLFNLFVLFSCLRSPLSRKKLANHCRCCCHHAAFFVPVEKLRHRRVHRGFPKAFSRVKSKAALKRIRRMTCGTLRSRGVYM